MQRIKLLTIVSLLLVFAVPQTTKAQEQQQLVVWL